MAIEPVIPKYYLYPSALFANRKGHMVTTVLGSCVAICLYDKAKGFGGINHYMLPFWNGRELASPKYGNIAIESLVKKMEAIGASRINMIAKVFGGANQLGHHTGIGQRNYEIAEEMLGDMKIKIVARSVGGLNGRKITFNTASGEVLMKNIVKQNV
ncbi:MAG: chemotaxis protein CheD [Bacteroidota bacterium]